MRGARLNLYERVAGFFILFAIVGSIVIAASVAIKQGWFETRVRYSTHFESAEGVHSGTSVKMAGLQVGSVADVELLADNRVKVTFDVVQKFADRIRGNSTVSLIRPFVIGDRVLEVSVGSDQFPPVAEHTLIPSEETVDLMSLMSGRRTGQAVNRLSAVMGNLQTLLEAFSNEQRVHSIVRMFDRMEPLIDNMATMSTEVAKLTKQINKDQNLGKVLSEVATLSTELNRILPELNKNNPEMGQDIAKLTRSLGHLTTAFAKVGGETPETAARMVEALNEATILIKAMQKSFFVRGSVREVREEESERERQPAASSDPAR